MRILLTVASFLPKYGGPAATVSQLGRALAILGHEVGVWAPDGSAVGLKDVDLAPSEKDLVSRLEGPLEKAALAFGRPDLIHDNGIWLPYNHAVAKLSSKLRIPRVVSPHGMLEPWALSFKPIRKRIASLAYQRGDLKKAQVLHATAESEAVSLREFGVTAPIRVVSNGVRVPSFDCVSQSPDLEGLRTILFLGRVHPKKGLPLLIRAFAVLRPHNWRLIIAGPDELHHMAALSSMINKLGLCDVVSMIGPVWGAAKSDLFKSSDLFVLPTYSENFGLVVAEALAHCVPVLTTTGAPWSLLVERQCGWWVEPTFEGITHGLAAAISISPEMRRKMGREGRALVIEKFGWDSVAHDMSTIYAEAIDEVKGKQRLESILRSQAM